MGKNQDNDKVQAIIKAKAGDAIKKQQEIESFMIRATDTPTVMEEKKARIEKRNLQQLAEAKAEFDAELNEAARLKKEHAAEAKLSAKIQADADKEADIKKAANLKKIEDAEVVENQTGLDMMEMTNARKQLNQERIDQLDKENFDRAVAAKKEQEENYERVHKEYRSVADSIKHAKNRNLEWSKGSLKTTNDELWTSSMPLYM